MICRIGSEQYYRVKDLLRRRCSVAAQEWLHLLNRERGGVEVYIENSFKGCMILHKGVNVFIATDSETTLREFLAVLDEKKGYAFRCAEWMAPLVTERFKPGEEDYTGVILLTYYTDENIFRKYTDPRYSAQPISEDAVEDIQAHARRGFTQEFIRERIRQGYFYGIHEKNELVSWVGTLWESEEACEIGFAYTKEEHRGKGLIKIVASVVTEKVLVEGRVPVAHTVETNIPAMKALERLGYRLAAREWAYYSVGN
jgi:RimJ/RimL family protein N-acetyltransferase